MSKLVRKSAYLTTLDKHPSAILESSNLFLYLEIESSKVAFFLLWNSPFHKNEKEQERNMQKRENNGNAQPRGVDRCESRLSHTDTMRAF